MNSAAPGRPFSQAIERLVGLLLARAHTRLLGGLHLQVVVDELVSHLLLERTLVDRFPGAAM